MLASAAKSTTPVISTSSISMPWARLPVAPSAKTRPSWLVLEIQTWRMRLPEAPPVSVTPSAPPSTLASHTVDACTSDRRMSRSASPPSNSPSIQRQDWPPAATRQVVSTPSASPVSPLQLAGEVSAQVSTASSAVTRETPSAPIWTPPVARPAAST